MLTLKDITHKQWNKFARHSGSYTGYNHGKAGTFCIGFEVFDVSGKSKKFQDVGLPSHIMEEAMRVCPDINLNDFLWAIVNCDLSPIDPERVCTDRWKQYQKEKGRCLPASFTIDKDHKRVVF